jgi:hypothetical protein
MPLGGCTTRARRGAGKGIKLREYWSRDKHCIWTADNLVLLEEPQPVPVASVRDVPRRPGPRPLLARRRRHRPPPRQVDLNKRLSQIAENAERIANPPLLVPSSLGDDFDWQGLPARSSTTRTPAARPRCRVHAGPGDPGVRPERRRPHPAVDDGDLGNHEVSGAPRSPTGVTAASAISLLQEQDDTRLGPDVNDMEQAVGDAGKRMNWLMLNYYTDERHLAIAGEGGRWDVQAYKGSQLGVQDIDVQAGSGMPQSKAAKQAAIQQFATLFSQNNPGSLSPRDWHRVMEDIDVGGLEHFFATISRDEQQVADENRRLAAGEPLGDQQLRRRPGAHRVPHRLPEDEPLPGARPDPVKQGFEQHVEAHRMREAMKNQSLAPPGCAAGADGAAGPAGSAAAGPVDAAHASGAERRPQSLAPHQQEGRHGSVEARSRSPRRRPRAARRAAGPAGPRPQGSRSRRPRPRSASSARSSSRASRPAPPARPPAR